MSLSEESLNAIKQLGIDYEPAAIGIAQIIFNEYKKDAESVGNELSEYNDYDKWLTRMFDLSEDIFDNTEIQC